MEFGIHVGTVVAVRVWNKEFGFAPAGRLECRLTAPLSEPVANIDAPHARAVPLTVPSSTAAIPAPPRAQVPGVHGAVAACKGRVTGLRWFKLLRQPAACLLQPLAQLVPCCAH